MKKIILLLMIPLLLIGCSKDGDVNVETESTNILENSYVEDITSVVISTYEGCRIVCADECWEDGLEIYKKIMSMDTHAHSKIGYYEMAKVDESFSDGKLEILVGSTGREQSATALEQLEAYLDYTVDTIDGKLVINAYSDERLKIAVDYFIARLEFVDDKVIYNLEKNAYLGKYTDYIATNVDIFGVALSEFSLVYPKNLSSYELKAVDDIVDCIGRNTGAIIKTYDDSVAPRPYEILMGRTNREVSEQIYSTLSINEYILRICQDTEGVKLVISYSNALSVDALLKQMDYEFANNKKLLVDFKGEVMEERMIVSKITQLRDPYILLDNGTYYAYGTGWVCYMNTSGRLDGEWVALGKVVNTPNDAINDYWAPEVYKYNGKYYMFTTYKSGNTGHRGCAVFCADNPAGPFFEISDGHVTPNDWDAIDGTLYIDEENQPWMIFVHEWTSTDDGVGRMVAAKMSDDLKTLISEPIELFRADSPSWSAFVVTDGCYMYRCQSGELIMIWSNLDAYGYCVGIARSDNGRIDGNWSQDDELLYSKHMTEEYDGGHGMIFTSLSGQLYLAIHSPNNPQSDRMERPVFVAIREENGTLVWDK